MQLTEPGLVWKKIEQVWGVQLTGTGLCLEMNRASVGRAVNWYWFVFGTELASVGRAVNWYRFLCGTDLSRRGACC